MELGANVLLLGANDQNRMKEDVNMKDGFYGIGNAIIEKYGIKPMTFEEEWNQPENAKQTRRNKMEIIDTCESVRRTLETIERRARMTPELDDPKHAALVQEFADKVNEVYKAVEAANMVGMR